jgi:hypothetical protein
MLVDYFGYPYSDIPNPKKSLLESYSKKQNSEPLLYFILTQTWELAAWLKW